MSEQSETESERDLEAISKLTILLLGIQKKKHKTIICVLDGLENNIRVLTLMGPDTVIEKIAITESKEMF